MDWFQFRMFLQPTSAQWRVREGAHFIFVVGDLNLKKGVKLEYHQTARICTWFASTVRASTFCHSGVSECRFSDIHSLT